AVEHQRKSPRAAGSLPADCRLLPPARRQRPRALPGDLDRARRLRQTGIRGPGHPDRVPLPEPARRRCRPTYHGTICGQPCAESEKMTCAHVTRACRRDHCTNGGQAMSTTPHLWAIGYDDMARADQVRDEITQLGWGAGKASKYLILEDIAVVVRHP